MLACLLASTLYSALCGARVDVSITYLPMHVANLALCFDSLTRARMRTASLTRSPDPRPTALPSRRARWALGARRDCLRLSAVCPGLHVQPAGGGRRALGAKRCVAPRCVALRHRYTCTHIRLARLAATRPTAGDRSRDRAALSADTQHPAHAHSQRTPGYPGQTSAQRPAGANPCSLQRDTRHTHNACPPRVGLWLLAAGWVLGGRSGANIAHCVRACAQGRWACTCICASGGRGGGRRRRGSGALGQQPALSRRRPGGWWRGEATRRCPLHPLPAARRVPGTAPGARRRGHARRDTALHLRALTRRWERTAL